MHVIDGKILKQLKKEDTNQKKTYCTLYKTQYNARIFYTKNCDYSYIVNFLRVSRFASVYSDVDSIVFTKLKQKSHSKLLKATFWRFDRLILSLSTLDKLAEH